MAFNIPIQERDNIAIQNTNPVYDTSQGTFTPVKEDFSKPLNSVADMARKQSLAIEEKVHTFAKNKFENDRDSIVDSNLEQVTAAEGENSFLVANKTQSRLKNDMEKALARVPEKYRAEFSLLADQGINRYDKGSLGHQYRQQNILMDKTEKQRAEYLTDQMAQSAFNPEKFEELRKELAGITDQNTRRKLGGLGGPASKEVTDAIKIHQTMAESLAITKSIESMVSAEYTDAAYGFAKKYENNLTAADKVKVNSLLTKGRANQKYDLAKGLLDAAMERSSDPTAQRKFIRDNAADGEVFATAVSMHTAQTNFDKTQKDIADNRNTAFAMESVRKSGGDAAAAMKIAKKLPVEKRKEVLKFAADVAEGRETIRDIPTYQRLNDEYINFPEKFIKTMENPGALIHLLPKEDLNNFETKAKGVRDPLTSGYTPKDFNYIRDRIIKDTVATQYKPKDKKYKEKVAELDAILSRVTREVKADMPAHSSKLDVAKRIESEMYLKSQEVEVAEKEGGVSIFPPAITRFFSSPDKVYAKNQTQLFDRYNPSRVDKMRSALQNSGVQYNPDEEDELVLKALKAQEFELSRNRK